MINIDSSIELDLKDLLDRTENGSYTCLGYPISKDFDYTELSDFMKYHLNNIGDPFGDSTSSIHTKDIERQIIRFFAKLLRAPEHNYWGYITNGGSEGNLYGLYVAREMYPNGMVYYSEATHYSVQKNVHLLGMTSVVIKAQSNGEIDYSDLEKTLKLYRTQPAIILANLGTTMTEGKDDVKKIRIVLKSIPILSSYIHVDGALVGAYANLLDERPYFDFKDGADSIAISGHKFLGAPIPCGIVIVKKNYRNRIAHSIEYIGSFDTTITGSRNGHSPLFLGYRLAQLGIEGLKKRIDESLKVAHYCEDKLNKFGYNPWRNKNAITVVFDRLPNHLCKKWQLASEGKYSHIICMPGVTYKHIDTLINDLDSKIN